MAGGNANFICLYSIAERVLLNRWQLSLDLSLDGTQDRLDSRKLTEAGAADLLDVVANEDELSVQERIDRSLPGAQSGDMAKRTTRRKARTKAIRFDPTGRSFAAATTLGLLVYSLDAPGLLAEETFDPMDLEIDLTPSAVRGALAKGDCLLALVGALRLNEVPLMRQVFDAIPIEEVPLILARLPNADKYVPSLLRLVAMQLRPVATTSADAAAGGKQNGGPILRSISGSPHLEFNLSFLSHLLSIHGRLIQRNANRGEFATASRAVGAALNELRKSVRRMTDDGVYGAMWMWDGLGRAEKKAKQAAEEQGAGQDGVDDIEMAL